MDRVLAARGLETHLGAVVGRLPPGPERTRRADDELAVGLSAMGEQFSDLVAAWRHARGPDPYDPGRGPGGARRADIPALARALAARDALWRSPSRESCAMDLLSAVVAMGYDVVVAEREPAA